MPGIYITQPLKEMKNIVKVGTIKDRDSAIKRLKSLFEKHYYPVGIKDIRKEKVFNYDKEGNRIKKGHPLYKILDKKCRDFEDMVKGFFKNNTVDVINDAHLRIVNKDDETLGHFDRSILNNGGSDFLLLNKKQLKQLDILFDETTGELEKYIWY